MLCAVFRSYAGFINTSLTTQPPHAAAADPVAPVISLHVDETMIKASLDLYTFLLHLATRQALDKVVTSCDAEGLTAWRSLVAEGTQS